MLFWTYALQNNIQRSVAPFKRVTDNTGSNFDTVPQTLLETKRRREGMFIHFHVSDIISHFLITFYCFYIICSLLFHGLICAHRSIFSRTYIHRLRHRLNSCSHSWDTKTRVNISFKHYVSTHSYQEFSHTRIAPFSLSSLQSHNEWFHPRTPPLCPCLIPEAQHTPLPLFFRFCFKSLHSNAARQPGEDFYFFCQLLSLLPIWADKGLQGLIWCLSLSPQLVSGLQANCRVWSVCKLIEISHSPPYLRPLWLQSSSPLCVWI